MGHDFATEQQNFILFFLEFNVLYTYAQNSPSSGEEVDPLMERCGETIFLAFGHGYFKVYLLSHLNHEMGGK